MCLSLKRSRENYEIGYRQVALKGEVEGDTRNDSETPTRSDNEWFTGGWFRLSRGDKSVARQKIKELLAKRIESQPLGLPNAGSVFRNPPQDWAARLIESCGLKGFQVGGAVISPRHANFIVNTGTATAADIEALGEEVRRRVRDRSGIDLVWEIKRIGRPAARANTGAAITGKEQA